MGNATPNKKFFPIQILQACSSFLYHPAFEELPDGYIRVVTKIIQKINLDKPESEIFASRSTLADECKCSLDTVHRAVKWLELHAMIERCKKAMPGLRGSKSPISATKKFLKILDISKILRNEDSEKIVKFSKMEKSSESSSSSSKTAASAGSSDTRRINECYVPVDLAWMCDAGLSPFGVLRLMGIASKRSLRLSDVMTKIAKYVAHLQGSSLYSYIAAVLSNPQRIDASPQTTTQLRDGSRDLDGTYRSRLTGLTYELQNGQVSYRQGNSRVIEVISPAFIAAIKNQSLVSIG